MNFADFFAMGGYAWYVWPSWLLTAFILLWNVIAPQRKHRQLLQQLRTQTKREHLKRARQSNRSQSP
ncbi:MAG: heme exporter protein CcmD [Proteobacteria bacterium]|jgi:heme exporter protein D|nr:heme exporter protein CcmD [Pseudomonadota bacterium]